MKSLVDLASMSPRPQPEWLSDRHPLLQRLGSGEANVTLGSASAALKLQRVENGADLRRFLAAFLKRVLFPLELPAIYRSQIHTQSNELRELIQLDQAIGRRSLPEGLAAASRSAGQTALRRLRPLRDERIVQRYLQAVEEGRAQGWHTLVYGLTLALYSLPVRQGLQNYGRQTLQGFIQVAARPLRLSERHCADLLETLCADLPAHIEHLLAGQTPGPSAV